MNLSPELRMSVEDKVLETILTAQTAYNRKFDIPEIKYEVKGVTAGLATYSKNIIDLNLGLLEIYGQKFIDRTVVHEIGHIISYNVFGEIGKGHNRYWKSVMRRLGGSDSRCHSYDTSSVKIRHTKKYHYTCSCPNVVHSVGINKHNKIKSTIWLSSGKSITYRCGKCHDYVKYVGTEK
jgi:SprT protein